jgi:hypothetical protein
MVGDLRSAHGEGTDEFQKRLKDGLVSRASAIVRITEASHVDSEPPRLWPKARNRF